MIVLLDTGPLGLVSNHKSRDGRAEECHEWLKSLLANSVTVCVPAISDYELRRELLRANKVNGIRRLDGLINSKNIKYLPITPEIMAKASELWAESRQKGHITAPDHALDGDVILAATAVLVARTEGRVVIATTNVKHLEWFTPAKQWKEINVEYCSSVTPKISFSLEVS